MVESLRLDKIRSFIQGLGVAFVAALGFLLYNGASLKSALFGFFYFFITPFLAIPKNPLSLVIIIILLLLFRRAGSCVRGNLRFLAYAILLLHWLAWGLYCQTTGQI
jgi:hypothetical protein